MTRRKRNARKSKVYKAFLKFASAMTRSFQASLSSMKLHMIYQFCFFVRLCLTLRKPLKRLDRNFKKLCIRQSASPVVVESDCHLVFFSVWGVFVRLRLTLRKPLKRLDLNFKILCSCPQAMPIVVIARGHLIFFSF